MVCQKVLPNEKFHSDLNFRQNLDLKNGRKFHMDDLWKFLADELLPFIHLEKDYNGDKLSVRDQKFNSDQLLLRLGSARIYQFRKLFKNKINKIF